MVFVIVDVPETCELIPTNPPSEKLTITVTAVNIDDDIVYYNKYMIDTLEMLKYMLIYTQFNEVVLP